MELACKWKHILKWGIRIKQLSTGKDCICPDHLETDWTVGCDTGLRLLFACRSPILPRRGACQIRMSDTIS